MPHLLFTARFGTLLRMNVVLSPQTQTLLEERMRKNGYSNPDDAVRAALETLNEVEAASVGPLDSQTIAAIEEGEAQLDRGEGRSWEELKAELQGKYLRK